MEYVKFIVTIIIILVIFYIAETQRKSQEKETKKMQSEIKKDDKIITYAGLTGIVDEVLEDRVILKVNNAKSINRKVGDCRFRYKKMGRRERRNKQRQK